MPRPHPWAGRVGVSDFNGLDDRDQPSAVVDVADGEGERQRQAAPVAGQMEFGDQARRETASAPALLRVMPVSSWVLSPLRAPTACWRPRTMLESTHTADQVTAPTASSWT
nr:hypothetical protein [Actinomadura verrucosospora]